MPRNEFLTEATKYILASASASYELKQSQLIHSLKDHGMRQEVTNGVKSRASFVGSQAAVEALIANMMRTKKLAAAVCVIHAPRPSTPLLIKTPEDVSHQLVNLGILNNKERKKTVTDRVRTLRNLLAKDANTPVVVLYPENGLESLTDEQRKVYKEAQTRFPLLEDKPVKDFLEDDRKQFTGATYMLKDQAGKYYVYSIQSCQANTIDSKKTLWGVWLGEYKIKELRKTEPEHAVGDRFDTLQKEVFLPNGVDIAALLEKSEKAQQEFTKQMVR